MTKGLPDPPASLTTAPTSFSTCESSHPPLFSVRPGVDLEDALVHLSTLLRGAYAANLKAMELANGTCFDLLLGNDHGLESATAVVEALLKGLEARRLVADR
ncbi:DUF3077 domain-containing protein [Pseudomonas fulva]|uniref:DUF3077 domain-containing protein n=1 Tax=Pseudomonas TaxID=286 RepID=UPI00119EC143|nr:DUF3077 domain-containing protein [Pseudomonas sp. URMO17WK12:I11]